MSKLDEVFEAKSPRDLELREQFSTPDQQRETAMVGMWVFLITEVLLFGALFTALVVAGVDPAGFFEHVWVGLAIGFFLFVFACLER